MSTDTELEILKLWLATAKPDSVPDRSSWVWHAYHSRPVETCHLCRQDQEKS